MQAITSAVTWLDDLVWGVPMLVLLLGVGLYLTVGLRLRTIRDLPFAFAMLWRGRIPEGKGEITPFNALDDRARRDHRHGQYRRRRHRDLHRRARVRCSGCG